MDLPELVFVTLRPRVGWGRMLVGLLTVWCLPFAASASKLNLPNGPFFWAALLGYLLGLWSARDEPPTRRGLRWLQRAAWLLIGGVGAMLAVLAADDALPSFGLVLQDAGAFLSWCVRASYARSFNVPLALIRSWVFLAESLPRFARDVISAPDGGRTGARLIVALGGVTLTWVGTLLLGWQLSRGRALLFWSLPLLLGLALTTIFSGASGAPLVFGLALLFVVVIGGEIRWRERLWELSGTDFSDDLHIDTFVWGSVIVICVLLVALVLPTSLDNPLAALLWGNINPPSGVAVLQEQAHPIAQAPVVPIGISRLPMLELGLSLEQGPPGEPALRVQLSGPLPQTAFPHYWRARLFNMYTNRGWTNNALVHPENPIAFTTPPTGTLVQTIDDLRNSHTILVALPDLIAVDIPANAERLADGTLAALTTDQPAAHYRVLSLPMEYAVPPAPTMQVDLTPFIGLPPLPQRVVDLARAATNSAKTPFEQALALEAYLRELPYSYQVETLPQTGDAVDYFLFDTRHGYCTYYASAMAVLARTLGIPARVATGYATGEYDAATRTYTIYERDAHAWPELYIDGRWMAFEPTPIRPLPARDSTADLPTPVPVAALAPQPASISGPLIWAGVLVIMIGLSVAGILFGRKPTPLSLASQMQQQLEQLGARLGIAWPPGATLHEYGMLLAPHLDASAAEALGKIIALVGQARYSTHALNADDEQVLRACWQAVGTPNKLTH